MKLNFLLYKILLRGERMDEHLFGNGQQTISHKEVLRVIDCYRAIFRLCHSQKKLIINEMMMRSALYQTNTLSWIFIVLVH